MQAMKFRVNSPQHSKQIQQALFDAGYAWQTRVTDFKHTDAKFLFAAGFGFDDNGITYECDDEKYFKEHETEEYFLVDGKFVKAGDHFKNMKINVGGVFGNLTHITNFLLKEGYTFAGNPEVYNNAEAFFTYGSGIITKTDDPAYFKSHHHEEYVMVGEGFKKASEYFVQPKTKLNIPERFENPVTDGDKAVKEAFDDVVTQLQAPPVVTDDQIIAKQKAVADKVLNKLFPVDPFAICAGGAPRDWHFGKPATDLDIFFYTGVEQLTIVEEMLRRVGINIDNGKAGDSLPEWYKLNPDLKCVYAAEVNGVNVQLMLMQYKTQDTVVPKFPFSICKAWYKRGHITLEKDFLVAERNKVVVKCNTVYNDEHKYVQKIKAKFPDWQFCDSWEEAYKHAFYNKGK